MIQEVKRKREGKDQPEEQRSVRELPICSFHGSKSIAVGGVCKAISLADDLAISRFPAHDFVRWSHAHKNSVQQEGYSAGEVGAGYAARAVTPAILHE